MLTLRLNELSVDAGSTMKRGRRRRRTTTITTTTTTVPKNIITARSYQNSNLDGCKRTNRKRRQGWESKNPPLFISSFAGKGGFASEDEEGKRRREQARDLVRNLLDASFLSSNTNGCKLIPCDRPPSSLLTGSLQLTYRERSVPDVENSFMHKCQLVSSTSSSPPMARRFRCRKANKYIAHLFFQISKHSAEADIQLSRFDLFHGHVFKNEDVVGILFHAKEYCRFDENTFNVDLGYCQIESYAKYDPKQMEKRNIIWVASLQRGGGGGGGEGRDDELRYSMAVLDTSHYSELLFSGQSDFHTIYEGDFGDVLGDVFYFDALKNRKPQERVIVATSTSAKNRKKEGSFEI